jgi:hypothetical protein
MNDFQERIKKIKELEQEGLANLSHIKSEQNTIITDYVHSLQVKKIEDLKNDIQSM